MQTILSWYRQIWNKDRDNQLGDPSRPRAARDRVSSSYRLIGFRKKPQRLWRALGSALPVFTTVTLSAPLPQSLLPYFQVFECCSQTTGVFLKAEPKHPTSHRSSLASCPWGSNPGFPPPDGPPACRPREQVHFLHWPCPRRPPLYLPPPTSSSQAPGTSARTQKPCSPLLPSCGTTSPFEYFMFFLPFFWGNLAPKPAVTSVG